MASAWYEVFSVVHMMAMLALFEANLLLIPKNSQVGGERKVSEGLFIFLLLLAIFFFIFVSNFLPILMTASSEEDSFDHTGSIQLRTP